MTLPHLPRGVLFDMDGTLLDTERLYQVALREACNDAGHDAPEGFFLQMIGRPWTYCYAQMQEAFERFDRAHFDAHFDMRFKGLVDAGIPLKPGVEDLLSWLAARETPMAVATSTFRKTAEKHLSEAGIRRYFQAVVTRDMVENGKPAPDSFIVAAARLGVAPRYCLALEDSPAGVEAAAAAGAMTIMIPDAVPATANEKSLCVTVVSSMADVLQLIRATERAPPTADI